MGTAAKLGNAAVNGTLKLVGKFMEGHGNVWKSLLKKKSIKEGVLIATNSFKNH
jgi:hypothetical protein